MHTPSHTEIIERVTRGEQPPFRPSMALQSHLEELGQLMQRCWAEDPQERPPFQQIRLALRKFNKLVVSSHHCHHKAGLESVSTVAAGAHRGPSQPHRHLHMCITRLSSQLSTMHSSFLCQH